MFAVIGTQCAPAADGRVDSQIWDALAEKLYDTALIQTPGPEFIAELKEALKGTSPSTQQRWAEVLHRRMVDDPNKHSCVECLHESLLSLTVNSNAGRTCKTCSAATESPLDLLANSSLVAISRQQNRGLARGDDCQTMLESSFARMCDVANQIVLIDRFAVADAVRAHAKVPQSSGLQKILQLADSRHVARFQLHVAEGFKVSGRTVRAVDVPALMTMIIGPLNLSNMGIEIIVQSSSVGMREIHDRSIAFTWTSAGGASFSLGKGMAQFDGSRVSQDHDLGRKSHKRVIQLSTRLTNLALVRAKIL